MAAALEATVVTGVKTNLPVLRRIMEDAEFLSGTFDTGLLGRMAAVAAAV